MAHRIREAMRPTGVGQQLGVIGKTVEANETYVGGKAKNRAFREPAPKKAVLTLVERDGRAVSFYVANVTAKEANNPDHVRQLLIEQVTGRVRWRESVLALRGLTVDTTVEFGGNKVLTGMVKRIDKELANVTLDTPADLEAFGKTL